MVAPDTPHYRSAIKQGNTLGRGKSCVHWVHKTGWLESIKDEFRIVGVELAEDATRLADLAPAREKTLLLLGHEHQGIPTTQWHLLDEVVEIPMIGTGHSLNVAVAGSLALYKLSGLI